jgi:uncharacterized protein (TIGR02145 family)
MKQTSPSTSLKNEKRNSSLIVYGFILALAATLLCTSYAAAQVTIGDNEPSKAGAILDLNNVTKGGLLLSNVVIFDLEKIPAGTDRFPGIYVWDGGKWNPLSPCNDPCPVGWRVPTQAEWSSLIKGGMNILYPITSVGADGTYNTWLPVTGSTTGSNFWNSSTAPGGYLVYPIGSNTPSLFLPASGSRRSDTGNIWHAGEQCAYWSSTVDNSSSYSLVCSREAVDSVGRSDRACAVWRNYNNFFYSSKCYTFEAV